MPHIKISGFAPDTSYSMHCSTSYSVDGHNDDIKRVAEVGLIMVGMILMGLFFVTGGCFEGLTALQRV